MGSSCDTSYYLKNQSPTSALVDKTPHEVWSSKKPSIAHLRVFGCDTFMHVPKEKRSKMDNKAKKCIFVGYKDGIKGYKLWILITRKIVYSQNVVFREVKGTSRNEDESKEKGPEKMEFELKNEGSDSFEGESYELDDEVELQTPTLRRSDLVRRLVERYSPPDFRFVLYYLLLMMNLDILKRQLVLKNENVGRMPW